MHDGEFIGKLAISVVRHTSSPVSQTSPRAPLQTRTRALYKHTCINYLKN